jgi:molybdopterin-containing oxidoreductase family iron-sulfur binding subunit
MPEQTEKTYWKSLAEREALQDPSLPMPTSMPEAGVFDQGLAGGLMNLVQGAADIQMDRAGFLKLLGFGVAGAALAGCNKAAEKALPYLVQPEDAIPGVSNFYATVCGGCSAGCGALTKTRDARPVKMEGNPSHPLNTGALCATGQASVLGVYDNRRLKAPRIDGKDSSWAELDAALMGELKAVKAKGGKLRLLSRTVISPTLQAQIQAFLAGFSGAKHVVYDPLSASAILDAHAQTHGRRVLPRYRLEAADVIVGFDADFLGTWISPVEFAKAYQAGRKADKKDSRFSKHIQVESGMTVTGSKADKRLTLKPSQVSLALGHLAKRLGGPAAWALGASPLDAAELDAMAKALTKAGPAGLVLCGSNDLQAQLITNWINHKLGAYGRTLDLKNPSLQRQGDDRAAAELVEEVKRGEVQALLVLDADPVYDLPNGAELAESLKKVPVTVSFALGEDDTAALCKFRSPDSHWLESWSDAEPVAGLVGLIQPGVRPLHDTRQAAVSLAAWSGAHKDALGLVQDHWKRSVHPRAGAGKPFQAFWEDSLQKGVVSLPGGAGGGEAFRQPSVALTASPEGLELEFYPRVSTMDGKHAENPWLQELPDPINKMTWDQVVNIAPVTAKRLGLAEGDMVSLSAEGLADAGALPLHLQPGQHPDVLSLPLGFGRVGTDRFNGVGPQWVLAKPVVQPGERLGRNLNPLLQPVGGLRRFYRSQAAVKATGENIMLACTQMHQSLDVPANLAPQAGRRVPIVQELTLTEFRQGAEAKRHEGEDAGSLYAEKEYPGHRWAMAIDMNACNGCSACVVACDVENNVPVVGREEVRRSHEMHWIRIDRYYSDGADGDLDIVAQPMMCQQCGHAPCEPVCPVDATVTSSEGLNMQTYNRCVGTRYCANNCPYKVRRFNWFDYPALQGEESLTLNPDVTVRSRGVMEKCNFCVQRIQEQKAESKRRGDGVIKDGDIKTACQQTCPAEAIVFGDINDPASRVSRLAEDARAFKVLEELNVKPSVSYLALVRNKS